MNHVHSSFSHILYIGLYFLSQTFLYCLLYLEANEDLKRGTKREDGNLSFEIFIFPSVVLCSVAFMFSILFVASQRRINYKKHLFSRWFVSTPHVFGFKGLRSLILLSAIESCTRRFCSLLGTFC